MFFSLRIIALVGVLAAEGIRQRAASSQTPATTIVDDDSRLATTIVPGKAALTRLATEVNTKLTELDDRYQQAFQRRIDALVSGTRHAQWREITGGDDMLEISPEDKMFNRRIARWAGIIATASLAKVYTLFLLFTIPLAAYSIMGHARWTVKEIKRTKKLKMEHLLVVFTGGIWLTGYFVIGGISFLIYDLITKMTLQSQDRTRKEMVNILGEQPHLVWVFVDGIEIERPFERLQVGDTLVVQAGQMIPIDGIITQGEAAIEQHRLTGESQPAEKRAGDPVLAATVVLSGRIHVQVEKTGEATLAAQIGHIFANTLDYHLSIEQRGKAIADRWVMPSLLMTGLAGVTLGLRSAIAVLSNMPGTAMPYPRQIMLMLPFRLCHPVTRLSNNWPIFGLVC